MEQSFIKNDQDDYDAFAGARLQDSLKLLQERQQYFLAIGYEHTATQDMCGGEMVEHIVIRWRPKPPPKPETNGVSHGPLS